MPQPLQILIVDDSREDALLIVNELRRNNYQVEYERVDTAAALADALDHHVWDAIICDYVMPQFSALDALALLHEYQILIPFLLVSGVIGEERAIAVMQAGANAFVMKDNLSQLGPAIERALHEVQIRRVQQHAFEALQQSEERYALAARGSNDGLWDWNVQTNQVILSTRWKAMLGWLEHEIGTNPDEWFTRIHPDDYSSFRATLDLHMQRKLPHFEFEHRMRHKNGGYRWVLTRGLALWDAEGHIVRMAGSQTDITERKRLQAQLVESQKMESVGRLAGGIAHDFNNLLTAITGYTDLALSNPAVDPDLQADLREILRAADRAAVLTQQLLAFARRQPIALQILNLHTQLNSLETPLQHILGSTIELEILPAQHLSYVRVDPRQLERVLINLATNARDAMPYGGRLSIGVENLLLQDCQSDMPFDLAPGQYVCLSVSDTGVGMSPEVQSHLFEPFFTTKTFGQGCGLGLATCYGIIKQHGGAIHIYSRHGAGTTVKIYLPQAEGVMMSQTVATPHVQMPQGSETILVVEDETAVRALALRILRTCGYTVLEADSGASALRIAGDYQPATIDLLLSDMVMPGLSGQATAERIKQLYPAIKVLFMSGYPSDDSRLFEQYDEQPNLLPKPFSPMVLAKTVRMTLDTAARPERSIAVG